MFREMGRNKYLYLLATPGLCFLFVFAYLPMMGHLIAFKHYSLAKGIWGSPWAGWDNFKFFFQGKAWLTVTLNTLLLNSLFLITALCLAVILSIFLNEIKNSIFRKASQSIIFLPYFVSWAVVGFIVLSLLRSDGGPINQLLEHIGVKSVAWYSKAEYWRAILTVVYDWKFVGYNSVIFLAAISGLSNDYYESATIDGANRLQQITYITLPLIRPVIIILLLLGIGRIFFGDFGMIYGIVGDNSVLYPTTDVIETYSYRSLRQMGDFSTTSAITLYQSIVGFVIVLVFNAIIRKTDPDSKLF